MSQSNDGQGEMDDATLEKPIASKAVPDAPLEKPAAPSSLPGPNSLDDGKTDLLMQANVKPISTGSNTEVDPEATDATLQKPVASEVDSEATDVTLQKPATPATPSSQPKVAASGPRFRILRPHARGGLGEVLVACDQELNREVALKQILGNHAKDADSRSRFLLEAEITGGLEHPGIVPVYGLGTYGDGRPYYAMRFIRGDSLKDAIEQYHKKEAGMDPGERTLALRSLLGRFVDVCHAIHYAHCRGVLHRDLKPGNIMLGKYGETLVVDWGLAKALGANDPIPGAVTPHPEPGEGSLMPSISSATDSIVGAAMGTPQYMSPEQAAGRLDQLGPASDIYSLGATLYTLLTGKPSIANKNVLDMIQQVQRGDFPRPRQVKESVPLPLEAICLKAMALKIEDRYATARLLADDIESWLADEPVSAWPEPWTVKTRRWLRRHMALVTGVLSAVGIALVGLIIATILLTAANERERQAKDKAEENFQLARTAVDHYYTQVSEDDLLKEPGQEPLRRKLLIAAREFYEKFEKERAGDPGVQAELGKATFRLAQITAELDSEPEAIKLHEKAAKLFVTLPPAKVNADTRSDLAACYHHLGRLYRLTDQLKKSAASYQQALTVWEELVKQNAGEVRYQDGLARTQLGLGNLHQLARRREAAQKLYEQAIENWKKLHAADPKTPSYRRDLGIAHNNLGMILTAEGKVAEANKALGEAKSLQEKLIEEAPNIGQYQIDLARTEYNLGEYQEAAKLWQSLVDRHPAITNPHRMLADAYLSLAPTYLATAPKKSQQACEKALILFRKLASLPAHAEVSSYQGDVARSLFTVGGVYEATGRGDLAQGAYEEAVRIQEKLVESIPDVPNYRRDLGWSYNGLGRVYARQQQFDKADAAFKKGLAGWERLIKDHGSEKDYNRGLFKTCLDLGLIVRAGKSPKDAVVWFERALEVAQDSEKAAIQKWIAELKSK